MVKVLIPTALKQYTDGSKTQIVVKASTVSEALAGLLKENKRLAKHIVDEEGNLRNFVNIFLNSEDIRHLNGQDTKVTDADTLRIVPAIAGGAQMTEKRSNTPNFEERKVMISPKEYRRYGRHLIIPEVGMEGQRKLKAAKVLIIGTGGLGSPSSLYLAAAGVGTIGLIDFDLIDETNLHRQILCLLKLPG
ncbi:MAG: ThiF family adenylyltransferase, partial [Thaumarchaeota archaeon]|nr:ThiF family adenylyltransferase [Nitrososphaerota archaeon]